MTPPELGAHGRILLVDDSPLVLAAMQQRLVAHGLEVVALLSSTEALRVATVEGATFDLFILDVMMPELDGHQLTRSLRQHPRTAQVPVLLLTSLESTEDRVAGLEAGADDFFNKSVPEPEMLARVRSFIALGRMRARLTAQREAMAQLALEGPDPSAASPAPAQLVVLDPRAEVAQRLSEQLSKAELACAVATRAPCGLGDTDADGADLLLASHQVALPARPGGWLTQVQALERAPLVLVIDDEDVAERRVASFNAGAEDYLATSMPPAELVARVASALRRHQRYRSMRTSRDRAMLAAVTDPLTGLYNRGYFREALDVEMRRATRYHRPLSLLLVDLDHFKRVNDTHGHLAGDEVLRIVSARMRGAIRGTDVVARYGGEEFVVLLPETGTDAAMVAAQHIHATVAREPVRTVQGLSLPITISVGVACFPEQATAAIELVDRADAALYVAKSNGRNQIRSAAETGVATAPAPASAPSFAALCERLEHLVGDDLDSPLSSVRTAAGRLLAATEADDPLLPAITRLKEAADEVAAELVEIVAGFKNSR